MIELSFAGVSAPQVVCIGAHCDDIEIGCGGTLTRIAQAHPGAHFHCWAFSGDAVRQSETRACLTHLLGPDRATLRLFDFPDGYFPVHWAQIKALLAELSASVSADLVFTHARDDSHQDHRLLNELTWNHFRRHSVLEYEIVKYEGDLGHTNMYVTLSDAQMALKLDALAAAFVSQRDKPWFTRSTFEAIARLRGVECLAPSGFAEAFVARKARLAF